MSQASRERAELACAIRPAVRFGLRVAAVVALFFVGWAGFAPLDSASVASATVVVDSSRKTVQHLEGGVITDILVKDGDYVEAGQELMRLNATTAKSRRDTVSGKLLSARAAQARLLAEKSGAQTMEITPDLEAYRDHPDFEKTLESQRQVFAARHQAYAGQQEVLGQRIAQLREKMRGIEAQKTAFEQQRVLLDEEIRTFSALLAQGLTLKSRVLQLRRARSELDGNIGSAVAELANAQEKIGETETEKLNLTSEYAQKTAAEMDDVQRQLGELGEQLTASSDIYERMVITAPQAGVINGLKFHTVGGVVMPGAPIMDIVPQNEALVIEARIPTQDIDVVHEGQSAKVRLTAYRSRLMPRLEGKLVQVSADKFTDEQTRVSYYIGRVRLDEEEMRRYKDTIELYPGMPAEVFVVTGSRTLLEWLAAPLLGSFQRAFVEE